MDVYFLGWPEDRHLWFYTVISLKVVSMDQAQVFLQKKTWANLRDDPSRHGPRLCRFLFPFAFFEILHNKRRGAGNFCLVAK